MHVCVSIPEGTPPPAKGEIKHVEFYGEDEATHRFKYKKVENTLFFEYLKSVEKSPFERLMTVIFNIPMAEGEAMNFCENVLKRGIFCDNMYYSFLGHSDSQVSSRTCYFMNASEENIRKHLEEFYNFFEIKDLRLRAKKIGLLFSSFQQSLELSENDYTVIEEGSFLRQRTFTSGCGFMSKEIVSKIGRKLGGVNYPEPSAVLVRIQGFEGMLVLKEDLDQQRTKSQDSDDHTKIQLHKSMQKLAISSQPIRKKLSFMGIVDRSRPHENAYLDAKLIMLLAAREVPVEDLKSLQKDYFDLLRKTCHHSASADYFLRLKGWSSNDNYVKEGLPALRRIEINKMIDHVPDPGHEPPRRQIARIQILVPKARVVFGVCDPYNKLKYGECYFRPTLLHDDKQDFAAESEVFIARTPCYHPGDIRVLKLTHEKCGYEKLKDCLVLPVQGRRPQSFECAGGDLGGSKFLVCWDPQLIPKTTVKPCSYLPTNSGVSAKCLSSGHRPKSTKEIREEMIKYFASFTDDLPNQIDKTYMNLAKSSGLSSIQCEQISKMFYQATNSTVDRDALSERLKEFEQKEQTESTSSVKEQSTEESGLLGETEKGEPGLEVRRNDKQLSGCISCLGFKDPPFYFNGEFLQTFQEEATRFVREAQQKHYCD